MVAISLSGSGEGPGLSNGRGYSTTNEPFAIASDCVEAIAGKNPLKVRAPDGGTFHLRTLGSPDWTRAFARSQDPATQSGPGRPRSVGKDFQVGNASQCGPGRAIKVSCLFWIEPCLRAFAGLSPVVNTPEQPSVARVQAVLRKNFSYNEVRREGASIQRVEVPPKELGRYALVADRRGKAR